MFFMREVPATRTAGFPGKGAVTVTAIFFTFSAGVGAVKGDGWDLRYAGFESGADCWLSCQRDGFYLKPGSELSFSGYGTWTAQVVRA